MPKTRSPHAAGVSGPYEPLVEATAARLVASLGLRSCWYEPFPFDRQFPRIEPGRIVLPAAEPGIEQWSFGGPIELPVRSADLTLGRFVLVPVSPTSGVMLPPGARADAILLAGDVGDYIAASVRGTLAESP